MPRTQLTDNGPAAVPIIAGPARAGSKVGRIVIAVLVAGMLAFYLVAVAPTMTAAVGSLAGASPMWLVAGLAATAASMVAFAALRTYTLALGGARVGFRQTLAISYGAGAVHTTLPAGAVFSTTYAFRHLRSQGASAAATTWSMAISGLLSTLSLGAVGLTGLALNAGSGGSLIVPILEISAALLLLLGLVRISHHPDGAVRLAASALARINHLRGRPQHTGAARLTAIVADLRPIRPSGRDWVVSSALAAANWAFDLACLSACCTAVGVHVGLPALLLTYTAGMAAGSLLPLPAGLGAVEAAMTLGFTVAGAAAAPALAAVVLYRLLSTGSVVVLGWLVIGAQRVHPGHGVQPFFSEPTST